MAFLVLSEETAAKVLRQVEFYFSDSNLPRDKFLLQSIRASEDGLVSLPIICSFSRMRNHLDIKEHGLDAITPEVTQAVAEVLRKSNVLRVSEDGGSVGRKEILEKPELVQAEVDGRTVAAGPLPFDITIDQVERIFNPLGKVKSVRLPRSPTAKMFCGSALIEFASKEEAEKVLEMKLQDEEIGVELELETKSAFDERMKKLQEEKFEKFEKEYKNADVDYPYPPGLIVKFTLTRINGADGEGETAPKNVAAPSTDGQQEPSPMEEDQIAPAAKGQEELAPQSTVEVVPAEKEPEAVTPGAAAEGAAVEGVAVEGAPAEGVAVEGAPAEGAAAEAAPAEAKQEDAPTSDATTTADAANKDNGAVLKREDIKAAMEPYGSVKFVDFSIGDSNGFVRFGEAEEAQKARTAAVISEEGGLLLKDYVMTLEAVDGEAEKEYWKKLRHGQDRRRLSAGRGDSGRQWNRGGHAGHPGRRGGRGGGRGRGRGGNQSWEDRQDNGSKGQHKRFREDDGDEPNGNESTKKASAGVAFE